MHIVVDVPSCGCGESEFNGSIAFRTYGTRKSAQATFPLNAPFSSSLDEFLNNCSIFGGIQSHDSLLSRSDCILPDSPERIDEIKSHFFITLARSFGSS